MFTYNLYYILNNNYINYVNTYISILFIEFILLHFSGVKLNKIKIAIVGIGNCASSLIQGIHYYDGKNPEDAIGLMH